MNSFATELKLRVNWPNLDLSLTFSKAGLYHRFILGGMHLESSGKFITGGYACINSEGVKVPTKLLIFR